MYMTNKINTINNLSVLLQNFLTNGRVNNKSEGTLKNYRNDLVMLFRFIKTLRSDMCNVEFESIDISDVDIDFVKSITINNMDAFLEFLMTKEDSNSSNSRCRKVSSIKTFYGYLQKKKLINANENIALEMEAPKMTKRSPVFLTEEEGKSLINAVDVNDFNYSRDFAIIMLLLNCGLRREEISRLDVDFIKGDILRVIGKGDKERFLDLNDSTIKVLNEWLEVRAEKEISVDEKALFISQKNNRISKEAVGKLVQKYIIKAGLDADKFSTHDLRHTSAMAMYQNGTDIVALQSILGHEVITTTQVYVQATNKETKKAIKNNPFNCLV